MGESVLVAMGALLPLPLVELLLLLHLPRLKVAMSPLLICHLLLLGMLSWLCGILHAYGSSLIYLSHIF